MERIMRLAFLVLFIVGFIGAAASANKVGDDESPILTLIRDVRLAEEVNDVNIGKWDLDVKNNRVDGLSRIEALLADDTTIVSASATK